MINKKFKKHLEVIGANASVEIEGIKNIPAKIDTGADLSSIHAEKISVSDGVLSFTIFNQPIQTKNYKIITVMSSNGEKQKRYQTKLTLKIGERKIRASFTLADRSKNTYPVLIGRKAIKGKFIVDVSQSDFETERVHRIFKHDQKLKKNPFRFYQKYIQSNEKEEKR